MLRMHGSLAQLVNLQPRVYVCVCVCEGRKLHASTE